jgi:protoheme ferro-lyase
VKTHVLLINFGAPRTLDEVPVFLRNMMGTDMPEAMQKAVVERYRAIGGGSPLAAVT